MPDRRPQHARSVPGQGHLMRTIEECKARASRLKLMAVRRRRRAHRLLAVLHRRGHRDQGLQRSRDGLGMSMLQNGRRDAGDHHRPRCRVRHLAHEEPGYRSTFIRASAQALSTFHELLAKIGVDWPMSRLHGRRRDRPAGAMGACGFSIAPADCPHDPEERACTPTISPANAGGHGAVREAMRVHPRRPGQARRGAFAPYLEAQ
jgi:hypothetical protein